MQRLLPLILLSFAIVSGSAASSAPTARLEEQEAISALKAELKKSEADGQFSGAVLVARAGRPIFQQAYGNANREKKIRNTVDTKFRYGSMAKMFTAVAVMQLAQTGKLKLDDPISKFLPDYPNKEVAAVTIHQLLTHTGGTGDIFSPEYEARRSEIKEHRDYVALYGNRALRFEPGSKHEYSNYGFVLLGRIIEVVSGESYYDYVRDHVFKPAGMSSTDSMPEEQHVKKLSVGYTRGGPGPDAPPRGPGERSLVPTGGPLRSTEGELPYRGTSAGGGYSTVGDFLKFANALTSNRLLDAHYTALVTTGKVPARRPRAKYAYGFEDQIVAHEARRIGHGGGSMGMNGMLSVFPDSQYVVVVLANLDPPAAERVAQFVIERLPLE